MDKATPPCTGRDLFFSRPRSTQNCVCAFCQNYVFERKKPKLISPVSARARIAHTQTPIGTHIVRTAIEHEHESKDADDEEEEETVKEWTR